MRMILSGVTPEQETIIWLAALFGPGVMVVSCYLATGAMGLADSPIPLVAAVVGVLAGAACLAVLPYKVLTRIVVVVAYVLVVGAANGFILFVIALIEFEC